MPASDFSNYKALAYNNKRLLQRIFFSLAFISLCLNYNYHLLLHQIGNTPLKDSEIDVTYWIFKAAHLTQFILTFSLLFDIVLGISCILSLVLVNQTLSCKIFFVLHFCYFILYNMLAGHHYVNVGLLFMSFPFIFSSSTRFTYCFTLCRFAFCFILFSAACWKIARGDLFYVHQFHQLVLPKASAYLSSSHNSFLSEIIFFLANHVYICHMIWILLIVLEFCFVLGFFSFQYDKLLLINYLLFFVGGYLAISLYNMENLFFLLTLLPSLQLINHFKSFD